MNIVYLYSVINRISFAHVVKFSVSVFQHGPQFIFLTKNLYFVKIITFSPTKIAHCSEFLWTQLQDHYSVKVTICGFNFHAHSSISNAAYIARVDQLKYLLAKCLRMSCQDHKSALQNYPL